MSHETWQLKDELKGIFSVLKSLVNVICNVKIVKLIITKYPFSEHFQIGVCLFSTSSKQWNHINCKCETPI